MDLKIKYIGNDEKFWKRIQAGFKEYYSDFEHEFSQINVDNAFTVKSTFVDIYKENLDIIYVDYSVNFKKCLQLCKLLTRDNITRRISVVGLFENNAGEEDLVKSIFASVRINHYKSFDIHDVIYDPISLLDVNKANKPAYVRSRNLDQFELKLPMRVGYIDTNHFHVETNSYLNVGDIVDITSHPLQEIMPSTKVYVQKFYDRNLYYNTRFAYDLEFIYNDNDFFSLTNKNWLLFKKLKENPELIEEIGEHEQADILADMDKRKEIFKPIRLKIDDWLKAKRQPRIDKKLKLLIVDSSLRIFQDLEQPINDFPYSLNLQTELVGDLYQVQRTLPHLIVYRIDDDASNKEMLIKVVSKIKSLDDYEPYLLIFNSELESQDLRGELNYQKCLSYSGEIHIDEIKKMAKVLDEKLAITNSESKVFLKLSDVNSAMFLKKNVHVLGMTESILYFESKLEIPMWTVFMVNKPIHMLLTIVPHKEDGHFKSEKNVYRAIINGVKEKEKSLIRQLINQSFKEAEEEN